VEVALRLRTDLAHMGWTPRELAPHDALLLDALPSLAEVLQNTQKWTELGVSIPAALDSEQAQLSLSLPRAVISAPPPPPTPSPLLSARAAARQLPASGSGTAADPSDPSRSGAPSRVRLGSGHERPPTDDAAERGGGGRAPATSDETVRPATAGEEIWERHAWNSIDGSWRAF